MDDRQTEILRRLAVADEATLSSALEVPLRVGERSAVDAKTSTLVRLGALVALGSGVASYQLVVSDAISAGATDAEIAEVVMSLGPIVGAARLQRAAVGIGRAAGIDLDCDDT